MSFEMVEYKNFGACVRLSNGEVEVLVTADIGPRVIAYRFIGDENMLAEIGPENKVDTDLGTWHPRGGHRLWHAPEAKPRSYSPDNDPVEIVKESDFSVRATEIVEPATGIVKEMVVTLAASGTKVTIEHRLTNTNLWTIELAPWALTIMRSGGKTIIPQEPFIPHTDKLLPARPMVLWNYTDLSDSRWYWGKKFVTLLCDASITHPQKLGVANKRGWAGYLVDGSLFVKKFPYIEGETYPDNGCNFETFTSGDFMEVETVGSYGPVHPDCTAVHVENWFLFKGVQAGETEETMEAAITPLVASAK